MTHRQNAAVAVSHLVEGEQVILPQDAPWLAEFRREVTLFPNGRHDDQVDSLSQFLKWMAEPRSEPRMQFL